MFLAKCADDFNYAEILHRKKFHEACNEAEAVVVNVIKHL